MDETDIFEMMIERARQARCEACGGSGPWVPCLRIDPGAVLMAEHHLKTWTEPFRAVADGRKGAELRRDDRVPAFAPGDVLYLHHWTPWRRFWDEAVCGVVTHVARGPHVPDGYAMLSLAAVRRTDRRHPEQVRTGMARVRGESPPAVVVARELTA